MKRWGRILSQNIRASSHSRNISKHIAHFLKSDFLNSGDVKTTNFGEISIYYFMTDYNTFYPQGEKIKQASCVYSSYTICWRIFIYSSEVQPFTWTQTSQIKNRQLYETFINKFHTKTPFIWYQTTYYFQLDWT